MNATYVSIQNEIKQLGNARFQNLASASQYFRIYDVIRQEVAEGATILDWGCGDGHLSYFLLSQGYRVEALGMEVFQQPGLYRSKFGSRFDYHQADDPVRLPFEDDSLDAVISLGVLEHVRETGGEEVRSLREIRRVLKPGGKFLCFHFPNRRSYIEAMARRFPNKHHHKFLYCRSSIERLVADADLTLTMLDLYGVLPRNELSRLPQRIRDSRAFVQTYESIDRGLCYLLRPIAQNFLFVAVKPAGFTQSGVQG